MNDLSEKEMTRRIADFAACGLSVKYIMGLTGLRQSQVERRIDAALKAGMIQCAYRLTTTRGNPDSPDILALLADNELQKAVSLLWEANSTQFVVVNSPDEMFTSYDVAAPINGPEWTAYRDAERKVLGWMQGVAGQFLAPHLFDGRKHVVGVNWGFIVYHIGQELIARQGFTRSNGGGDKITWVSLCGDLNYSDLESDSWEPVRFNSNEHVSDLAKNIGASEAAHLTVPSFLPENIARGSNVTEIKKWLISHSSYRCIWGKGALPQVPEGPRQIGGGLIEEMDTIITGLGGADSYTELKRYLSGWLNEDEVARLQEYTHRGLIAGDIGAHILPTTEGFGNADVVTFLRTINRRLLAAYPSDFAKVGLKHRNQPDSGAGVVAVVAGARKAPIVKALVELDSDRPLNQGLRLNRTNGSGEAVNYGLYKFG